DRPRTVNLAVDKSLEIVAPLISVQGVAVQVEFHNVLCFHQPGSQVASQQKPARILVGAEADVTKRVQHMRVEENVVGVDEVGEQLRVNVLSYSTGNCV